MVDLQSDRYGLRRLGNWLHGVWCRRRADLGVLTLYSIITVLITYPVAWRLSSAIAGVGGDGVAHLWSLWWSEKAMLELRTSVADLTYFYHPLGDHHPLLSVTPVVPVTALPLSVLFSPLVTYNLFFLLSFVLTAFTTYLLCYEVTRNRIAAFTGGVIFGFAPTRSAHGLGHLAQIITYWFPLYALFVLRLMRRPSWKRGIWAGVLLGISALVNFVHTAYFVLPFTAYWLLYFFVTRRRQFLSAQFLKAAGVMLVVAAGLTLPFFMPLAFDRLSGRLEGLYIESGGVIAFSTSPLSFVIPSPFHPLVEELGARETFYNLLRRTYVENLAYVGVIPLALALWGSLKRRQTARLWLFWAIITAVLSLGPVLKWGGEPVVLDVIDEIEIYIPLPYVLLRALPFFEMGRNPARITEGTALALAVLVSLGMVQFTTWLRGRKPRLVLPVVAVITALMLLEYCVAFPYPTTPAVTPSFYYQVRQQENQFAILDYPLNLQNERHEFKRPMFYQTTHEHPIAGGKVWRLTSQGRHSLVLLEGLVKPGAWIVPDIFNVERTNSERVAWLAHMGFRYLVLHKHNPSGLGAGARTALAVKDERDYFSTWLSDAVYEDEYIVAFQIPDTDDATSGLEDSLPLTAIGFGWYDAEREGSQRWMGQEGQIYAYAMAQATYRLEFNAWAYNHPRQISLIVNDEPVYTTTVHLHRRFVTPAFTLEPGLNEIVFKAIEPCTQPVDVEPESQDQRCLSAIFSHIKWAEAETAYGDQRVAAQFGDHFHLLGYELDQTQARPGGHVDLVLYWEVLERADSDYTVFTHLLSTDERLGGQQDNPPVGGLYATTWLGPGEIVKDEYTISISDDVAPGDYTLQVGWYNPLSGERLPVEGTAAPDTRLILARIEIEAGE